MFHFEPEDGLGARMHWIIHGVHHDHPNDPLRLVMPPAVSVPLGAIVFGILYLIFGAGYAPGLGAGFFAGYLAYDMIHYYIHHFRARGPLGRMLRERHMRHHFQDDTRGFGISAPYWDEVFRTSSRGRAVRRRGDRGSRYRRPPPPRPSRASALSGRAAPTSTGNGRHARVRQALSGRSARPVNPRN